MASLGDPKISLQIYTELTGQGITRKDYRSHEEIYLRRKRKFAFYKFVDVNRSKSVEFGCVVIDVDDGDIDWKTSCSVAAIFCFQFKRITLSYFKVYSPSESDCTIILVH